MIQKLINKLILITIVISFIGCCDCDKEKVVQKKTIPLVGKMSWSDWKNQAGWKDYEAKNYIVDMQKAQKIKKIISSKKISFIMVSANWCSDSEKGVPIFFKLLKTIEYKTDDVILYGVDREKKEPTNESEKFVIEKVPTLIILLEGNELGRIVEYPVISWEDDILTIIDEL